ncbi:MAG: FAD:protein FMN transferase [Gammaproteobacteria bacterium]|nr:FAD:protein FMN transferase [Gammaproteobacteria bacterium]
MNFRRKKPRVASINRRPAGGGVLFVGLLVFVVVVTGVTGCEAPPEYDHYDGATMGTQYRITANCPTDTSAAVISELRIVNSEMSTYIEDSSISEFNRAPVGTWFAVSPALVKVIQAAAKLSEASEGAFDVTVGPLVNLWGFGPNVERWSPPDHEAVEDTRAKVGYTRLLARLEPPGLIKTHELFVDLSAIAKGHGVDRVATVLNDAHCSDYLIDIGGEVRARGTNAAGEDWRIGIEVPDSNRLGSIQRVLSLSDEAVATSGDYRNFFENRGQRYSHTIDPRTGYPVTHDLASVSVLAQSAMWADGYATLLNVLGPAHGLELATDHDLAALFVVRTENGFEERYTPAMRARLSVSE